MDPRARPKLNGAMWNWRRGSIWLHLQTTKSAIHVIAAFRMQACGYWKSTTISLRKRKAHRDLVSRCPSGAPKYRPSYDTNNCQYPATISRPIQASHESEKVDDQSADDPIPNALNTTEILEAVLSKLLMKDLLTSRKVSRMFNATIKGSIQLQRLLFLHPQPVADGTTPTSQDVVLSSVLYDLTRKVFQPLCFKVGNMCLELVECYTYYYPNAAEAARQKFVVGATIHIVSTGHPILRDREVRMEGSWKDMFLIQPRCEMRARIQNCSSGRADVYEFNGATLGQILKVVAEEHQHCKDFHHRRCDRLCEGVVSESGN